MRDNGSKCCGWRPEQFLTPTPTAWARATARLPRTPMALRLNAASASQIDRTDERLLWCRLQDDQINLALFLEAVSAR